MFIIWVHWVAELVHHSNINDRKKSAFYTNTPVFKLVHTVIEFKTIYKLNMFTRFWLFYSVSR